MLVQNVANDDLLSSAIQGNLKGVQAALGRGASPTVAEGRHGLSALHFAVHHEDIDMTALLFIL